MLRDRDARRRVRRAFVPSINERLEERNFTSQLTPGARLLQRRAILIERFARMQRGFVNSFTAGGGSEVALTDIDGERYRVAVASPTNQTTVQNAGTVQAARGTGGSVFLVIQGTREDTTVDVTPIGYPLVTQGNHKFVFPRKLWDRRINLAGVDVVSGKLGGFFGYQTTNLSGRLINRGTDSVDRVALAALLPDAAIETGGDLNTLDILGDADFSGTTAGMNIGRDLNAMNVGGNLTIRDGAQLIIGRDVGAEAQPPKGTGPAGRGIRVMGNLTIAEGSTLTIRRNLVGQIFVQGNLTGASRLIVEGAAAPNSVVVSGNITA